MAAAPAMDDEATLNFWSRPRWDEAPFFLTNSRTRLPLAQMLATSTGGEIARSRAPPAAASRSRLAVHPPWCRRAAVPVPDEEDAWLS